MTYFDEVRVLIFDNQNRVRSMFLDFWQIVEGGGKGHDFRLFRSFRSFRRIWRIRRDKGIELYYFGHFGHFADFGDFGGAGVTALY